MNGEERQVGINGDGAEFTALEMATLCLVEGGLADDFPPGFADGLRESSNGARRSKQEWATTCSSLIGVEEATSEEIFFSLVLIDDELASALNLSRPTCARFARRCEQFVDQLDHQQTERWDHRVGIYPTAQDMRLLPSLGRSVERGEASFLQVAEARCYSFPKFLDELDACAAYARFYPEVLRAFENKHGRVLDEFWCAHIPAGVVRADRGQIHLAVNEVPPPAIRLLARCDDLYRGTSEHLSEAEADLLRPNIYGLATGIYSGVDEAAGKRTSLSEADLKQDEERLAELEKEVTQRMERRAQRSYILGTLGGLLLIAAVLGVASVFARGSWQQLFEGAIFGAAGALASVLFRMHRGALRVEAAQGTRLVAAAALVRPLMGALFGGIVCALLLSTLLPIEVTTAEPDRFYYLATVAFIAGFAERWAPSLLQLTAGKLSADLETDSQRDST